MLDAFDGLHPCSPAFRQRNEFGKGARADPFMASDRNAAKRPVAPRNALGVVRGPVRIDLLEIGVGQLVMRLDGAAVLRALRQRQFGFGAPLVIVAILSGHLSRLSFSLNRLAETCAPAIT